MLQKGHNRCVPDPDEVAVMTLSTAKQDVSSESTRRELEKIEQNLRAEREDLLSELAVDSAHPDELTDGWQDRDEPSEGQIRDVEFVHRGALRQRIFQIEGALERIQLGTYGRCVNCGRAIESERLAQEPETSFCLSCQSELEGETPSATTWKNG
jgi:RNA polymerase-binding transcription factor DksA